MNANKFFTDQRIVALAEAAARGDEATVLRLVSGGADPNTVGKDFMTPLFFVLSGTRNQEGVKALIKSGANADQLVPSLGSAVTFAAAGKDPALLQALLDSGANPNSTNSDGEPALMVAALHDRYDNLDVLLKHGADVNATDSNGETTAITLTSLNQFDQVRKLIDRGTDISHIANNGQTIANTLDLSLPKLSPQSPNYQWAKELKRTLEGRGVSFPPPRAIELRKQNHQETK